MEHSNIILPTSHHRTLHTSLGEYSNIIFSFACPSKHFRMGQYRTYMFCISGVPTDLQSDPHNGPTYGEILGRYQADIYISVE